MDELELLKVENGVLRKLVGLTEGDANGILKMLAVLEQLNAFLAQVAAEQKPLLTKLVVVTEDGETVPVVSLWAAFGEGNPIDRIEQLNQEIAQLRASA